MTIDLFGQPVYPTLAQRPSVAVAPPLPSRRPTIPLPPSRRPAPPAPTPATSSLTDFFLAQGSRGATAEEASEAIGRAVGVDVAGMAARGELVDTGRIFPRRDGTWARMLALPAFL